VVFKVPDGWMPADKTEVGPIIFLNPKKPAAIFVTYPKQDETTTEAQRLRLRTLAAEMFLHGNKDPLDWQVKSIPSRDGDGDGKADIATVKKGDKEIQIVTYERTTGARPFIYGYIAMREVGDKDNSASFLDENGKGVKEFDKFLKTFDPEKEKK
ncbi:MAG TPA: hypothetical protein VJ715_02465, partial [Pyrinomonadaceae bacterium]|nr:hypothetical protein [Pyrinomonadaceae bacterium]